MKPVIKVLTIQEATPILKQAGLDKLTECRLRLGIEQGVYPFGVVVQCAGRPVYEIYSSLLEKWIAERSA